MPLGGDMDKFFLLAEMPSRGMNNMHWGIAINHKIRASGKKLVISGASGNATLSFDAKGLYAQWFRQGRWLKLWRELAADKTPGLKCSGIYSRAISPNIPASFAQAIARARGISAKTGWQSHSAIARDYADHMAVDQRAQEAGWDTSYAGFNSPREMMYSMLERGGREEAGPTKLAMETLTGVKIMDPMGSPRIMRFCAGIPPEQFLKNGNHRYLMTRMMKGRLPNEYFLPQCGRQSADWHLKMTRDIQTFRGKVARMKDDPDMAQIWYPSTGYHDQKGVLTGAYNFSNIAYRWGTKSVQERLDYARSGARKFGEEFGDGLHDGVAIAWQNMPYIKGGWAQWQVIPTANAVQHFNDLSQGSGIYDKNGKLSDPVFFVVGDQLSSLPGWQEGAIVAALKSLRRMAYPKLELPQVNFVPDTRVMVEGI